MTLREISGRGEVKLLGSIVVLAIAGRFLNWRDLTDAASRLDAWRLGIALVAALVVLLIRLCVGP